MVAADDAPELQAVDDSRRAVEADKIAAALARPMTACSLLFGNTGLVTDRIEGHRSTKRSSGLTRGTPACILDASPDPTKPFAPGFDADVLMRTIAKVVCEWLLQCQEIARPYVLDSHMHDLANVRSEE